MFSLVLAAFAGEGFSGLALPDATAMEAGAGHVGAAALGYAVVGWDAEAGVLPAWRAAVAPTDRLAITSVGAADLRGAAGTLGARYVVLDTPGLRVAPWLGAAAIGGATVSGVAVAGVAMDAGWERVRFDVSLPLTGLAVGEAGVDASDATTGYWLGAIEAGATFRLGERNELRVGHTSAMPTVSWRYLGERFYVDASAGTILYVSYAQAGAGVRF
ncbi:MAG: hypothetical protein ACOZNI_17815 [Myxococcota bacterium]